jgi:prolipoprotein diacylglyceryl transferase
MFSTLFIDWNPDVVAFHLGPFAVRWYSLCWCVGLLSVYMLMPRMFREQKLTEEQFDPMFLYCFAGILIGARLGHCLFYEPEYFLAHPLEMILPVKFGADGSWHFTGYEGLASHGGTIGLIAALWFFARKVHLTYLHVLDNVSIVTPVTAMFIRLGNLMNSEIIGRPSDVPWAFVFERVDALPRHPGQLYEALCYAFFFLIHWYCYRRWPEKVGTGFFFGLCIFLIFLSRIFIEYTKENQVAFEDGMLFNMGQLLSVPFVLLGAFFICRGLWHRSNP